MSDLRTIVADQVIDVYEITERYGPGLSTINMWTRGAVPSGAPDFPAPVKVTRKIRLYLADEVGPWITTHYKPRP